jgi:hypothetical protein
MKQNDVITVLTLAGEFIGKLKGEVGDTVTLEDPRMLVQSEQGMGFAHGVCVTGETSPTEVTFQQYVLATPTNEDIAKGWRQATSGLIM